MRQVGTVMIHSDGQTDMTKVIGTFLEYTNAPEKSVSISNTLYGLHEFLSEMSSAAVRETPPK